MTSRTTAVRRPPRGILVGLVVVCGIVGLAASGSYARDDESARATLRGLEGVWVLISLQMADGERVGFTQQQLRTDVELQLRQAGIRILHGVPWRESATGVELLYVPVLVVSVHVLPVYKAPMSAFRITVEVYQQGYLQRDPSMSFVATSWQAHLTGSVGAANLSTLRGDEGVKKVVDLFINAYLSVNPGRSLQLGEG